MTWVTPEPLNRQRAIKRKDAGVEWKTRVLERKDGRRFGDPRWYSVEAPPYLDFDDHIKLWFVIIVDCIVVKRIM